MNNQSPSAPETEVNQAPFTLSKAEGVMFALVDTVELIKDAKPTDEEKQDGVTAVEYACVSPVNKETRAEVYEPLSDDFNAAMLRILIRGDDDTKASMVITVTTRFGEPLSEGNHTSERSEEVYVIDAYGRVISGYHQITKEDWKRSKDKILERVVGDPIVGDDLVARAASRVRDIEICVSAGI